MNRLIVLSMLFLLAGGQLFAQNAPAKPQEEEGGEPTIITSDKFRLDLSEQKGFFLGNVHVANPKFEMDSKEVMIFLNEANKPERFISKGDVKIKYGERTATSRQAEYFVTEHKIVLTGDPVVLQKGNRVTGEKILVYPELDRMDVEGRSTVQLFP